MKTFILRTPDIKHICIHFINAIDVNGEMYEVTIKKWEPNRTLEQNALMWPHLQAFSEQKTWEVNGEECYMQPDEWKDVLTAGFKQENRVAKGLFGGVVLLGLRTSKFSKKRFAEFIEFMYSVAADFGIKLPARQYE